MDRHLNYVSTWVHSWAFKKHLKDSWLCHLRTESSAGWAEWAEFEFLGSPAPLRPWKHLQNLRWSWKGRVRGAPCKSQQDPARRRGTRGALGLGGEGSEQRLRASSMTVWNCSFGFRPKTRKSLIMLHILGFSFYSTENEEAKGLSLS